MQTQSIIVSTIIRTRLIAHLMLVIFTTLTLAGTAVLIYLAPDLFFYGPFEFTVVAIAFFFTIGMAWAALNNWEKASLISQLMANHDFIVDVVETLNHSKLGEEFVLALWKDNGGQKILDHMEEIKVPHQDLEDLQDSKMTLIKQYLKVKSLTSKAIKSGVMSLYFQINQIIETYNQWFDETWENDTVSNIDFYIDAYEDVERHEDIPERLISFQIELWEEFRDSEDANYFRAIDIDRLLEILSTAPASALQAWEHIDELKDLESTADDEIEGQLESASSSANTSGILTGYMYANMINSLSQASQNDND